MENIDRIILIEMRDYISGDRTSYSFCKAYKSSMKSRGKEDTYLSNNPKLSELLFNESKKHPNFHLEHPSPEYPRTGQYWFHPTDQKSRLEILNALLDGEGFC